MNKIENIDAHLKDEFAAADARYKAAYNRGDHGAAQYWLGYRCAINDARCLIALALDNNLSELSVSNG